MRSRLHGVVAVGAAIMFLAGCVSPLPSTLPSPPPATDRPSSLPSPVTPRDPTPTPGPTASPTPTPEPTAAPTPTIDPTSAFLGMDYACGEGPVFQPIRLIGPASAETEDHPSAAALRALIEAPESQGLGLPLIGWRLIDRTAASANYLARSTLDRRYVQVSLVLREGAWVPEGYGGCGAQLRRPGLGATFLAADPGFPPPDASTRNLHLLVYEIRCASGQPSRDRLRKPIVETSADEVRIAFGVEPLPGGQDCPGHPPTAVVVRLDAELGARRVLNASVLPFQALGDEF